MRFAPVLSLRSSSNFMDYGGLSPGPWPAALAGEASPATEAAAEAGEAKASRGDGHTLRAEDAANGSGGGGSDGGVLREGAEDGSGQGHHHGRGLDDDVGVLALPDAGLVAAVGQRGGAAGPTLQAWHALVVAGHVLCLEGHLLGQRVRRISEVSEKLPAISGGESQGTVLPRDMVDVSGSPWASPSLPLPFGQERTGTARSLTSS